MPLRKRPKKKEEEKVKRSNSTTKRSKLREPERKGHENERGWGGLWGGGGQLKIAGPFATLRTMIPSCSVRGSKEG